jgi:hypothetical protein
MSGSADPPTPAASDDVDSLLAEIQTLVARCDRLAGRAPDDPERAEALDALNRLQWKLAAAARRAAERASEAAA